MKKLYNLYSGMGGSFGGAQFQMQMSFESADEADHFAYQMAWEEYESYGGLHGIRSYAQVKEEYCYENNIDPDDLTDQDYEDIDSLYREEVEGWIQWKAVLADADPDRE